MPADGLLVIVLSGYLHAAYGMVEISLVFKSAPAVRCLIHACPAA